MWKDTGCWGERTSRHCSGNIRSRGWNGTLMGRTHAEKTFSFYQISSGLQLQSLCCSFEGFVPFSRLCNTLNAEKKKKKIESHDVGLSTLVTTHFLLWTVENIHLDKYCCSHAVKCIYCRGCGVQFLDIKQSMILSGAKRSCLSYLSDRVSVINPALSRRPAKISAIWGN